MMRRRVWSRNLKNEEAMARFGPQRHKKNISVSDYFLAVISNSWFIVLCGCLKVQM